MNTDITMINSPEALSQCISDGVTLVDFWAPWCGPCRTQLPILETLAAKMSGKAKVAKVNVDENTKLAEDYNVQSIPTLIVFKDGSAVQQFVGVQSEDILTNALETNIV